MLVDVIIIDRIGENFRLLYDVKGRFIVYRIIKDEAKVSKRNVCKILFFRDFNKNLYRIIVMK